MLYPEDYVDQSDPVTTSTTSDVRVFCALIVAFGILFPLFLIGLGWLVTR